MNNKNYFLAGFISYTLLQLINIIYSLVFQLIKIDDQFIKFTIISLAGVGIMGGLLSMLFIKIQKKLPEMNIYVQSGIFHTILPVISYFSIVSKKNISIHTVTTLLFLFLTGVFIAYLIFNKFSKKEKMK